MPSNLPTALLPRLLPAVVCLVAGLPCQNEQTGEDVKAVEDAQRAKAAARGERAAKGEAGETGEKDESDASLTPEQRLARHITNGASSYCRFRAALKPDKLMPGQTGTLTVVASMLGDAVLPSPPPTFQVMSPAVQGEVTLGSLVPRPASVGRHARGYLGRPVYDNYALFDVPVTLSPNAVVGTKHPVAIELQFDLYDGNSAQPIGRFLDRVSTSIEAGKALDPLVQGMPRANAGTPPPTGEQPEQPAPTEPKPQEPARAPERLEAHTIEAPAPAPAPDASPSAAPSPAPPAIDADAGGGLPLPLLIGGGVLVLAVVVLLMRRR